MAKGSLPIVLQVLGLIAAPTTLVTALLFYFGWVSTVGQYSYFSVSVPDLGLSTTDYLLRSTGPMLLPIGVLLVLTLLGLCGHAGLLRAVAHHPGRLMGIWIPAVLATAGFAAIIQYFRHVFPVPQVLVGYGLLFPPTYLTVGTVLLSYAVYLRRLLPVKAGHSTRVVDPAWIGRALSALTIFLVVFFVFWTVTLYADAYGRTQAVNFAARLDEQRSVKLYSARRLYIQDPAVREVPLQGTNAAYRYRYEGLRLLAWTNGRFFLLPDDWSSLNQTVIVIPDSDAVRVELRGYTR